MSFFRRAHRSRVWRTLLALFGLVVAIDFFRLSSSRRLQTETIPRPVPSIYIASIFWNSAPILYSGWRHTIVDLAEKLGTENVFISIYESGSWDNSKELLRELIRVLESRGVQHRIILDETTHQDEIDRPPAPEGWLQTPRGRTELRRIPYLSKLRNKVLEPLAEFAAANRTFDKILFLNDVSFKVEDVWTLLATNAGNYAAACSLDFSKPPNFYDTFALRDSEGHERLMMTYPFFRSRDSRRAMLSNRPIPVRSCWNGMVVFDPSPFYGPTPLRFRGISDSLAIHHLEASECCLIHTDNPQTALKGVWLNPRVRVGYDPDAYSVVHALDPWPSFYDRMIGLWRNRLRRWLTTVWFKEYMVSRRVRNWAAQDPQLRQEGGMHCLINEMQVLISNGWAHV